MKNLKLFFFHILHVTCIIFIGVVNANMCFSQDNINQKLSDKANRLLNEKQYKKLRSYCNQELPKLLNEKVKDSSEISLLNYYQFEAQYQLGDYLESLKSAEQGIKFCNDNQEELETKVILFYKKAYAEDRLRFFKRSLKSMENALEILEHLDKPNLDYLTSVYIFLSQNAAYNGNLEEANRYLRLSENLYLKNREKLDSLKIYYGETYSRYEVVLNYKKIYALYQLGKTKQDSLKIEREIKNIIDLERQPNFNTRYESIYYTTALNHIGDWYLSRKPEDSLKDIDFKKANYYLNLSINAVENKNYIGDEIMFKYNKTKSLNYANKLTEADDLITELLNKISPTDGRLPFFYAQKGLIQAKLQQKDSALFYFYKAIEKVHAGKDTLSEDYKNFKPSATFGQTKLISRIADKLYKYYKDDKSVQQKLSKLYYLAFLQFENSYNNTKYNKTYDELLREIMNGILTMKQKYGYINFKIPNLLNRTEIIQNRLAWQNFYQNRFVDNLPELDVLHFEKLNIRKQLVYAKKENDLAKIDSLSLALESTEDDIAQQFPNLDLLKGKNFDVEDIQNQLKTDELVFKYMVLDRKIAIFQINKNEVKVDLQKWSETEKQLLNNYIESIKTKKYDVKQAEYLGELLLPNIKAKTKHLIINPDAELCPLAFETLIKNNQFLSEKYPISYTSSLAFIYPKIKSGDLKKTEELVVYLPEYNGDYEYSDTRSGFSILDGAKMEVENIAKLFSTSIYTSDQLTKQDFINTAKDAKLLHLAMHAEVDNNEPGLSRFLFGNSENDDNHLYLEEIYGMNIGADLAVLSACNTGYGKETAKKSMASFQRAFTFAGIPATVASLWEVPDQATSQIMHRFYIYLDIGHTKSTALQKAKTDYIQKHEKTKLAEPYYWAGFVVNGYDAAIVEESNLVYFIIAIVLIVLISILIFLKKRKQTYIKTSSSAASSS